MVAALTPKHKMTAPDFFNWVSLQERGRFELFEGDVIAMAPEISDHARAKFAIAVSLRDAIKRADLHCEAFVDGLGIQVDDSTVYEPDALVNCGEKVAPKSLNASNPVIVVEVISSSSRRKDTGQKLLDYFRVASIHHYLVFDLARRLVIHHTRQQGDGIYTRIVASGELTLDPPRLTISIDALFPD